ncbi:MAG: hypothetical protein V3T28_03140 [Gemmatimonadales bacterium]
MAKKLSAMAQQAMTALDEGQRKIDRIHSLIEQYASTKQDYFTGMIARASADVGRLFMDNKFGVMSDHANQIGMLAKRGGSAQSKFTALRETLSSLRGEMERKRRAILHAAREGPAGQDD